MQEFEQLFKNLHIQEKELQQEILNVGVIQLMPKDSSIIEQDKYIKWLAIVIRGKIGVWQENEGHQNLLYYVKPFQTCVLSLSAVFKDCLSIVNVKMEIDSVVLKIPANFALEWSCKFQSWNKFTTHSFIYSYEDLLYSYKDLAFKKIYERLIEFLRLERLKNQTTIIDLSHDQLAKEIGTTRKIISKILRQFELQGIVNLRFKQIELITP